MNDYKATLEFTFDSKAVAPDDLKAALKTWTDTVTMGNPPLDVTVLDVAQIAS